MQGGEIHATCHRERPKQSPFKLCSEIHDYLEKSFSVTALLTKRRFWSWDILSANLSQTGTKKHRLTRISWSLRWMLFSALKMSSQKQHHCCHCSSHLVKVFVCWFPRSLSVAVSQTFSTDKFDKPTKPLAISSEESVLGSAQKGTHSEGQHPVSTVWSADDHPYWPMDHYIPLLPFQWRGSMPSATHWWGVDIRHTLREWAVCFSRCW